MALVDEATAFLQGEVGKFLALPSTLQEVQGELQAIIAAASDPGRVDQAQALLQTVGQLQGRYSEVRATVEALIPQLQGGAIQALSFDQALTLARTLAETTGSVVSILSETADVTNQAHQLYYGTPGAQVQKGLPTWVWAVAAGLGGWWLLRKRR